MNQPHHPDYTPHVTLRTGILGHNRADNPAIIDVAVVTEYGTPEKPVSHKPMHEVLTEHDAAIAAGQHSPHILKVMKLSMNKDGYDTAMNAGNAVAQAMITSGQITPENGNHHAQNAKTAVPIALFELAAQGVKLQQFTQGSPAFDALVQSATKHQMLPHDALAPVIAQDIKQFIVHQHAPTPAEHHQKMWTDAVKQQPAGPTLAV